MHLTIITPDKKVFEGEVIAVKFPGTEGPFQVLKDHAPLISTLEKGAILYSDKRGAHTVAIEGGIVEVLDNKIIVLMEETHL
ncbi:MAG: ATP synthase F1 subunit epsilon [Cytophagales bacterium]|nr:ATP synthase F1 subunit epsilon [Cytophagales bacterium]